MKQLICITVLSLVFCLSSAFAQRQFADQSLNEHVAETRSDSGNANGSFSDQANEVRQDNSAATRRPANRAGNDTEVRTDEGGNGGGEGDVDKTTENQRRVTRACYCQYFGPKPGVVASVNEIGKPVCLKGEVAKTSSICLIYNSPGNNRALVTFLKGRFGSSVRQGRLFSPTFEKGARCDRKTPCTFKE